MTTWLFGLESPARSAPAGTIQMPVDRLALEQFERAERRRAARREMQSDHSSVSEKIRAWERLHGLQLPRDPNHIVLRVIARRTGLSVEAVLEEQRIRASQSAYLPALTKSTT